MQRAILEIQDGSGHQHLRVCGATLRSLINQQRLFREMQQQRKNPQGERYLQNNYSIRQFLQEDAFKTWFHGIGKKKKDGGTEDYACGERSRNVAVVNKGAASPQTAGRLGPPSDSPSLVAPHSGRCHSPTHRPRP